MGPLLTEDGYVSLSLKRFSSFVGVSFDLLLCVCVCVLDFIRVLYNCLLAFSQRGKVSLDCWKIEHDRYCSVSYVIAWPAQGAG